MPIGKQTGLRIRRIALVFLTAAAALALAIWLELGRNSDEEYAVYSAYLSDELLNNAHDWSVGRPVQVVVDDTTETEGNLRLLPLTASVWIEHLDHLDISTRASFSIHNLFRVPVLPKFILPSRAIVVLVSRSELQSARYGSP
jgi:hypothetical protein